MSYTDYTRIYLRELERAEERRRREAEIERRRVESVNAYKIDLAANLRKKIGELEDAQVKAGLFGQLDGLESSFNADRAAAKWRGIGDVREAAGELNTAIRQAALDQKRENRIKVRIAESMSRFEDAGSLENLPGLKKLYDMVSGDIKQSQSGNMPQQDRIAALSGLARDLDEVKKRVEYSGKIDYAGFTEEAADLEQFIMTVAKKRAARTAKLQNEITAYFDYLKDFDKEQATAVREFYDEAMACGDVNYLDNLRTRIYRTYTDVRRATEKTVFFRQELADSLPVLRVAKSAGRLVAEIERTIDASVRKYISNEDYYRLYKDIVNFRADELERNLFTKIASVTKETLTALGYTLVEDGREQVYTPEKVHYYDSPAEDYRVGVSISEDGQIKSSVVRLKDGEEATGESDEKLAKKWCGHLSILHGTFETSGLDLENVERREPVRETVLEPVEDKRKNAVKKIRRKKEYEEQQKMARLGIG